MGSADVSADTGNRDELSAGPDVARPGAQPDLLPGLRRGDDSRDYHDRPALLEDGGRGGDSESTANRDDFWPDGLAGYRAFRCHHDDCQRSPGAVCRWYDSSAVSVPAGEKRSGQV